MFLKTIYHIKIDCILIVAKIYSFTRISQIYLKHFRIRTDTQF